MSPILFGKRYARRIPTRQKSTDTKVPVSSHRYSNDPDNPVLVLVHGLGSAGSIWKSLVPQLIESFTVYAIDLPGHGDAHLSEDEAMDPRSLAQAVVDYMVSQQGVETMHVAGNSLGGWIALEMAAVAPDNVASVTALAPAGLWHELPPRKLPPSLDARIMAKISQYFMKTAYRIPLLKAIGYKKITHLWRELSFESCRDSVIAMARSKGYRPMWHGANGRRFESEVPEKVKLSVVFGDEDLMLPEAIAQEKSVAPAHSRWIIVDNCPHVIMWNYPTLTVELIKKTALVVS
jgi:pimeloyl-ACP methyl ester carboxylesterase